jgi:hypothetical protein
MDVAITSSNTSCNYVETTLNDLYCGSFSFIVLDPASGSTFGITCDSQCDAVSDARTLNSLCASLSSCSSVQSTSSPTSPLSNHTINNECGDGVCDIESELCLNCSMDCRTCIHLSSFSNEVSQIL